MTRDGKESVLSRWSRRKLEAREAPEEETSPAPAAAASAEATDGAPLADDAEAPQPRPPLTDADMPDIETLNEDSDFSPFMSAGVSDELRNLALRKLFKSSVFNIRDGLDEYDDDYTQFETLGDIVTSDMKHQIEMQEKRLREKLARESSGDAAGQGETDEADAPELDQEDAGDTDMALADADGETQEPAAARVTDGQS